MTEENQPYRFIVRNIINILTFKQNMSNKIEPYKKMKAPSGIRDVSVCSNQHIFLAVVYDTVRIYDTDLHSPIHCIKLDSTPRSAKISQCGKYFYVHDSNNTILLYDTRSATILQVIYGAPVSTKSIKFSKNSQKLIYGSTQMLCLWNIRNCSIDVRTQHWKNLNCYDVNQKGTQFALGTYNGVIYVLDFIQVGRCTQIQIKRHKTCVAALCYHKNKIISVSHDGYFLISSIQCDQAGQRLISYSEMKLKSIPRDMESIGENYYMYNNQGMIWFNKYNGLTGFTDYKTYKPYVDEGGKVMFVSLWSGEMEWWPAEVFKTVSEIQKQKAQQAKKQAQLKKQKQKEKERQLYRTPATQDGKQNRVVYRVVIKRQR